jgi:hypothetical protein
MRALRFFGTPTLAATVAALFCGAVYKHRWHPTLQPLSTLVLRQKLLGAFDPTARTKVAFIFRPLDCAAALAQIDTLNALDALGPVHVVGFMLADERSVPEWREIAYENGITFSLQLASSGAVRAMLHNVPTPIILGPDAHGGLRIGSTAEVTSAARLHARINAVPSLHHD